MTRYAGKAWDACFLPRLSRLEVQRLPKEETLVVLPVGATEQHGPHLPSFTDTLIGEALLTEAFERLPEDAGVWLLPPIPFGKSTEHAEHPGTITFSAETLMKVLLDVGRSLSRAGFPRLLLFNTHGGNADLLNMMAREIRIDCGLTVFRMDAGGLKMGEGVIEEEERRIGLHGGDLETSLVLGIKSSWVHMELAPHEVPNFPGGYLDLKNKAYGWVMSDLSASGITGDASIATEGKGELLLTQGGQMIAEALLEMAAFDMKSIRSRD
ncbi:creatininase family protein [Paenibacillus antri]|uniref:Creatininase family protein n=2 Tax=Paenibacillus antri TaxID=2582848 RepID=A0A5R9GKG9_9BACL|nr:creatininase family protein [Paenibacillus antri]